MPLPLDEIILANLPPAIPLSVSTAGGVFVVTRNAGILVGGSAAAGAAAGRLLFFDGEDQNGQYVAALSPPASGVDSLHIPANGLWVASGIACQTLANVSQAVLYFLPFT